MMKNRIIIGFGITALSLFISCSENSSSEEPLNDPEKVTGVLPSNGEPCSDYEAVPNEELKVSVLFKWDAAQFATGYILVISDGAEEVIRKSFTTLVANVTLDRGRTYTWNVLSVNDNGETNGDTYSFTTPGIPTGNYAPYAAEISVGFDSITSLMTVSWFGSDEDGDDLMYDVRIFQENELIMESLNIAETSLAPFSFNAKKEYLIEVVSKDQFGNYSISRFKSSD